MITDETINALDRDSGLNAQDFDFQDLDFNIPMDDFESMWINGPANNNGMGISNNSGFNNQVFMNNQTFMNSNMVANNNWAMTPTLAAAPQVVNNNNNYAAMAGYMPMDTNLPMSNPMAAPLDMPTANTTMATGQFCKYICLDPGDAAVVNRKIGRGHSQQTCRQQRHGRQRRHSDATGSEGTAEDTVSPPDSREDMMIVGASSSWWREQLTQPFRR